MSVSAAGCCALDWMLGHPFLQVNWGDLEVQKQIGEGSFGRVYLAKWRETTVAVKVLSSTGASSSMEEEQEAIIDNAHLLEGLAKVRLRCMQGLACLVLLLCWMCMQELQGVAF